MSRRLLSVSRAMVELPGAEVDEVVQTLSDADGSGNNLVKVEPETTDESENDAEYPAAGGDDNVNNEEPTTFMRDDSDEETELVKAYYDGHTNETAQPDRFRHKAVTSPLKLNAGASASTSFFPKNVGKQRGTFFPLMEKTAEAEHKSTAISSFMSHRLFSTGKSGRINNNTRSNKAEAKTFAPVSTTAVCGRPQRPRVLPPRLRHDSKQALSFVYGDKKPKLKKVSKIKQPALASESTSSVNAAVRLSEEQAETEKPPVLNDGVLGSDTGQRQQPVTRGHQLIPDQDDNASFAKSSRQWEISKKRKSRMSLLYDAKSPVRKAFVPDIPRSSKSMQTGAAELYPDLTSCEKRRIREQANGQDDSTIDTIFSSFVHALDTGDKLRQQEALDVMAGQIKYKCRYCGKVCLAEKYIRRHVHLHTNVTGYNCSKCVAHYATRDELRMHERVVHEGECNFRCNACDFIFVRASYLKTHLRTQAHLDVVAGRAKPRPQVFNDGLPMHSQKLNEHRKQYTKKYDKIPPGESEWDIILPPELQQALDDATAEHAQMEANFKAANGLNSSENSAAQNEAMPNRVNVEVNEAVAEAGCDSESAVQPDKNAAKKTKKKTGRNYVKVGSGSTAMPDGKIHPDSNTECSSRMRALLEAVKLITMPDRRRTHTDRGLVMKRGHRLEFARLQQTKKTKIQIYRFNYCEVCNKYMDHVTHPLAIQLHRQHLKPKAKKEELSDGEEKNISIQAVQTDAATTTDDADLNVDSSDTEAVPATLHASKNNQDESNCDADTSQAGKPVRANKLSLWKEVDVDLIVPFYWDSNRTLQYVYSKTPDFLRPNFNAVKKRRRDRRPDRRKKDDPDSDSSELDDVDGNSRRLDGRHAIPQSRVCSILENVDFTDPDLLAYVNFDSSLRMSKHVTNKMRKEYYNTTKNPIRCTAGANGDGGSSSTAHEAPAIIFGRGGGGDDDNRDFDGGDEDANNNYLRIRMDKWQQALRLIGEQRTQIQRLEAQCGGVAPDTDKKIPLIGAPVNPAQQHNNSNSAGQQDRRKQNSKNFANIEALMSATSPVRQQLNNAKNQPQFATPLLRRSMRKRRKPTRNESSSSSSDEEDDDGQSEDDESDGDDRNKKKNNTSRFTAAAAAAAAAAALPKTAPKPVRNQQTLFQNNDDAAAANRSGGYQPATSALNINAAMQPPYMTASTANTLQRQPVLPHQQQRALPAAATPSSMYVRADHPDEVQRLLRAGWTISGLLPAPGQADAAAAPANTLGSQFMGGQGSSGVVNAAHLLQQQYRWQ